MDLGLAGKNVVVTGGSRGIGRAAALEFAREGANVAICARGEEALAATRAEIEALGGKTYAARCDVADASSLERFLTDARDVLDGVDVLVNNPSGFGLSDDEAGWGASLNVDVMATVRATWCVVPWMAARGGGAIVNVSSIAALEASPIGSPAYAAAKAAVLTHAKSMALQLAPQRIRINAVVPGSIEFAGGVWAQVREHDRPMYDSVLATIPYGRMGTPEEVAAAIVFLASARASWISGAMLAVDGVQHKGLF